VLQQHWLRDALRRGLAAARQNAVAGVLLWLIGTIIVSCYFFWAPARASLDQLGSIKQQYGLAFSVVSTAVFGGLIPTLLSIATGQIRKDDRKLQLVSNVIFWGMIGIELDLFYRLQAWVFGAQPGPAMIACKTLVDQFIYVPLLGLLNVILFSIWRDHRFSGASVVREILRPGWYQALVLPVLISNWCLWLPAVVLIYLLPLSLQVPIQNLVLVFWMLILTLLTKSREG
jgi:hypothetical protein